MLEIATPQMRCQHAADRTLVGRVVRVPADIAVDRTDVQASAATNAMQHLALLSVGQKTAPSVIYQDNVKFFRTIGFSWLTRAGNERAVCRDRLPCAGGGWTRPR